MFKTRPKIIGTLGDGIEVEEVICPVCGCDRNDDLGNNCYRCFGCGMEFQIIYEEEI